MRLSSKNPTGPHTLSCYRRRMSHDGTAFSQALLDWFRASARVLPWRSGRTPYRVWVSETMLQQTQVATVIPYFERWLKSFPDLTTLADAPQEAVLKAWEGLGYYRRARLLQRGAQVVVQEHGGRVPGTYRELLELPGIGPYTAAAIASLAFGEAVLAVDGNVKRVAARLFCLPGIVTPVAVKTVLEPHLPSAAAGDFNEALMELGATICTPRSPRCDACPVRAHCEAFRTGRVSLFPEPVKRKAVPHHYRYALIARRGDALWLRQRSEDEMLGGLWGFVLSESKPEGVRLEPVQHAYTHFRITAAPVLVAEPPSEGQWIDPAAQERLPLSKLDHKILARVRKKAA